jgi:hypothetical protein
LPIAIAICPGRSCCDAERDGLQCCGIDSNDGQIGRRIVADDVRRGAPPIRQRHIDPGRIVDYVAVGENQSIRRKYETGAASATLARAFVCARPRTTAD